MSRVGDQHRRVQRGTHRCPHTAHPPCRARLHRRWHTHRPPHLYHTTRIGEGRRHHRHHRQTHVPPAALTVQTKFLLLSRSLQRRLAHFSRVCRPDAIRVPFSKLQVAVEEAAVSLFQSRTTPTPMGLPHSLVRQQLRLPVREGGFDLNAAGGPSYHAPPARNIDFSLTMASLMSSYLSSAARCHTAPAASPTCLRPLSQLQYTGEVLFHTPIPSATRLVSFWRQPAIDMREFYDPSLQHHPAQLHLSPTAPACTVSAAAMQGLTLTQSLSLIHI